MQESLFTQGVDLMLFGMGTVCVFLALLVVITTIMSKVMSRFFPEVQGDDPRERRSMSPQSIGGDVDKRTLTIIQAAVAQHRKK